ncbi:tyrosine-type recombinase/integrase [Deinococcus malanensis]
MMLKAKEAFEAGTTPRADRTLTIAQLLTDWLDNDRTNDGLSKRTIQLQSALIRLHIAPRIGKWTVVALSAGELSKYYRALLKETELERTRYQVHTVLKNALAYAVKQGYINLNPLREVRVPQRLERRQQLALEQERVKAWTPDEAKRFVEVALAEGHTHSYACVLALRTGLRSGEVYGLRWEEVDLAQGTASITHIVAGGAGGRRVTQPKTRTSRRTILLSEGAVQVLRLAQQFQGWVEGDEATGYVFTTRAGEMQHPDNSRRTLERLCKRAQIPFLSFHGLRHTFVSIAAESGLSVQHISSHVGHANTLVTQKVYIHLRPELQERINIEI